MAGGHAVAALGWWRRRVAARTRSTVRSGSTWTRRVMRAARQGFHVLTADAAALVVADEPLGHDPGDQLVRGRVHVVVTMPRV